MKRCQRFMSTWFSLVIVAGPLVVGCQSNREFRPDDDSASGGRASDGRAGNDRSRGGRASRDTSSPSGSAVGSDASNASTTASASDGASRSAPGAPLVPGAVGIAAANYMIATWPELDFAPADCTGPSDCFSLNYTTVPAGPSPKFWEYTYGVALYGLQKLYDRTGNQDYFQFVKKYVDRYVNAEGTIDYGRPWPYAPDGGPGQGPYEPVIQDVIQPSTLLFALYDSTRDPRYLAAMKNTRKVFESIPKNSSGAFWHKPNYAHQQWLDGVYMAEPFLTKYGALYAEAADAGDSVFCFDTAATQISIAANHTFDPETRLYFHAWNGAPDGVWQGLTLPARVAPLTSVSPVLWSRSLAWFFAGTLDVLEYLPEAHPGRPALLEVIANLANGLKRYQDPASGLWYQVIDVMSGPVPANGGYPMETDRPGQPNWTETSASALFAYALAKSVRLGYLGEEYLAVAKKGWTGVKSQIDIANETVTIHGTVVGMSVGGTYHAYVNADFRQDVTQGIPPAPSTCLTAAQIPPGTTPTLDCHYVYVRDNVPQGFAAVLLASSELEF